MSRRLTFFCSALFCLASAAVSSAQGPQSQEVSPGWKDFRGPERSGVSRQPGLLRSWPESGPKVIWQRALGEGFSGISVAGDLACTGFAVEEDEFLGCFKVADGELVWRERIGKKFYEEFGNGPRATPTIDGDAVYGLSSDGLLVAAGLADGKVLWKVDLAKRYPIVITQTGPGNIPFPEITPKPQAGHSSSPLVDGELIVVYTGSGHGRSVVALDKMTGEERWTALDSEIGYSSMAPATFSGQRQFVLVAHQELVSLSPAGEVLWRHPWAMTISQPLVLPPDKIFVSTSYDVGALVVQVQKVGERFETNQVWKSRVLKNFWGSSVYYEGHLYGFDNATLRCVSAESGETRWAKRGMGKGNLVIADGMLIILGDRGQLVLAKASPESFEQTGEAVRLLEGRVWTAPSVDDGRLFLRDAQHMFCVDLKR